MVKIITDTTSCLSESIACKYNIPVIPQVIHLGNEAFLEGIEIDNQTFISRLRASPETTKTAAPPIELFTEAFQKLTLDGEPILCIHPSTEVSGTVRSATVASQDFPDADIRIIDTRTVATPLGTMVEQAAKWASEGCDADTIVQRLEDMIRRCRIYFLVDTLEYLARGGRIGGAQALLGGILQIKPILTFVDGHVNPYERERTHKRALSRLIEIVQEQIPHDGSGFLTVMHAGVPDQGNHLAETLSILVNQPDVRVADVPPAIVTHGGPGILGAGFFVKD